MILHWSARTADTNQKRTSMSKPHSQQSPEEVAARIRFSRGVGLVSTSDMRDEDLDGYITMEMREAGSGSAAVRLAEAARYPNGIAAIMLKSGPSGR